MQRRVLAVIAMGIAIGLSSTALADGQRHRAAADHCRCRVLAHHHRHHGHYRATARVDETVVVDTAVETSQVETWPAEGWPVAAGVAVPPWNSAYDRAMVGYLRSPELTGYRSHRPAPLAVFSPAPVIPAARPVAAPAPIAPAGPILLSWRPYRILVAGTVYEYDTTIGQYVTLASRDAGASIAVAMTAASRAAPPLVVPPR